MQPPLKFYTVVIEDHLSRHPDARVLITTEEHGPADAKHGGNPVVAALRKWRPSIQLWSPPSFHDDVGAILAAKYLVRALASPHSRTERRLTARILQVLGVSSMSSSLALMSTAARRVYIPQVTARPAAPPPRSPTHATAEHQILRCAARSVVLLVRAAAPGPRSTPPTDGAPGQLPHGKSSKDEQGMELRSV